MRLTSIVLFSLLASQLVACATDAPVDPADGFHAEEVVDRGIDTKVHGAMTASGYLEAEHARVCDVAFSCRTSFPTTATESFSDGWGESTRACYEAPQPDDPRIVDERVAAGALHFDASAADACLSGIEIHSCLAFWSGAADLPSACDSVLVGTVAQGGTCVLGIECAGASSFCDAATHLCSTLPAK